jgi:hypothetical protein
MKRPRKYPEQESNVVQLKLFADEPLTENDDNLMVYEIESDLEDACPFAISFDIDGMHIWQPDSEYIFLSQGQQEVLFHLMREHYANLKGAKNDNERT